jgi:hypothetical protein
MVAHHRCLYLLACRDVYVVVPGVKAREALRSRYLRHFVGWRVRAGIVFPFNFLNTKLIKIMF